MCWRLRAVSGLQHSGAGGASEKRAPVTVDAKNLLSLVRAAYAFRPRSLAYADPRGIIEAVAANAEDESEVLRIAGMPVFEFGEAFALLPSAEQVGLVKATRLCRSCDF